MSESSNSLSFKTAYASYLTSPAGYGLLGPSAAMAITSSLASTPATPSTIVLNNAVAIATTPPSSTISVISPSRPAKESHQSGSSDGSNSQMVGGRGIGSHVSQTLHASSTMLTMPSLSLLPLSSSATSDDDALEHKGHKSSLLFSSFLPIQHLRLQAQERQEQSTNNMAQKSINKESDFDSTSPSAAKQPLPPLPNLAASASQITAYQQS